MIKNLNVRLWWLIAFLASVICCVFLILKLYNKWVDHPVLVSFVEKATPVWEIPFPALTICLETKFNSSLFNYTDVYLKLKSSRDNMTDEEKVFLFKTFRKITFFCRWRTFDTISQVCDPNVKLPR